MTLELIYWLALGGGLAILTLSLILGDIFDFFDIDIGDAGVPIIPVFFAATAAFGAGGLIGVAGFGLGTGGSIVSGLITGVAVGLLAGLLFAVLRRQEAGEGFQVGKLTGLRGRTTLAVGPGRVGRVAVQYGGMTRSLSATSAEEIPAGHEVVVRDVVGNVLTVSRAAAAESSETAAERP